MRNATRSGAALRPALVTSARASAPHRRRAAVRDGPRSAPSQSALRQPTSGVGAPPRLRRDARGEHHVLRTHSGKGCSPFAVGARRRVLLMEGGQALHGESIGQANECWPQTSVDERHLPVHQPRADDIRGVSEEVQGVEDRMARWVAPPASADRFASDQLGDVWHRSVSGLQEHPLLDQCHHRLHRSHPARLLKASRAPGIRHAPTHCGSKPRRPPHRWWFGAVVRRALFYRRLADEDASHTQATWYWPSRLTGTMSEDGYKLVGHVETRWRRARAAVTGGVAWRLSLGSP